MPFPKNLRIISYSAILLIITLISCIDSGPRVLVFSKTNGWKHTSIPFADKAIIKLGAENDFAVDTTKDASVFNDKNLKKYKAVIFNNTTRNVLNAEQQAAFERYIQAGGGFVGIHSAADTEYEWPWYGRLVGAWFESHPHNSNIRKANINVTDKSHMSTSGLPDRWERTDEWYNYKSIYNDLNVLAYLDESTYDGGTNGTEHPIAWYHEYDGGRAFYTGGGHEDSSYDEPLFLEHLLGGIKYAMGTGELDYSKSYSVAKPDENRFVKTVLVNDLNNPMELAVSDDGRVFFTELRTANLGMFNTANGQYTLVHRFDVATKGGTGLIGVTLDPDFTNNNFIYLYYSPPTDVEPIMFNLSRFVVTNDNKLDISSEKVLLQVPVQENSGAHHGGSLAWDKDGNLFLSTGDSSSPFPADGYAPLDERPGKEFYSLDAQRGASNTNDFKGKVLRIHPEPDGSYTIPDGNLFPKGTEKTLPEIYAMGCRNPYRIAVNPKTSVLYWGEIGPDAGKDSIQGPRGYDEFNQAKTAGNYGWPYFVGNNQAYNRWNFETNTPGEVFNPDAPKNTSPNNTGLVDLPVARSAMIYYPYAASPEFPELGVGGRSAMAGMFYTYENGSASEVKFPAYYNGALFVFDWMRNWVIALRFDDQENYVRSEPLMASNGDFRRPIDLAFGKDGVMYMLEYGSVYGADNVDARLVKIEYNQGNRAPTAKASVIDSVASAQLDRRVFLTSERRTGKVIKEIAGPAPLRVLFNSMGTNDPDDDDAITYEWLFDGRSSGSTERNPKHVYTQPGSYYAVLKVTDKAGYVGEDSIKVTVGNAVPEVHITSGGNTSFFWDDEPFTYSVSVTDKEDEIIDPQNISVSYTYTSAPVAQMIGSSLITASDCKACHTLDDKSVGPSYMQISQRYKNQKDAVDVLTNKIIAGGGGSWGTEHVMSAHPQLPKQDVNEMVKYILSLTNSKTPKVMISQSGALKLKNHKQDEPQGVYTLVATYTDKGANGIEPLTKTDTITLRNAKVKPVYADAYDGFSRFGNNLTNGRNKSYFLFKNVDLTTIKKFLYTYSAKDKEGEIEVRIDSKAGPVIAKDKFAATGSWDKTETLSSMITVPTTGRHDVYIYMIKWDKPNNDLMNLKEIIFSH